MSWRLDICAALALMLLSLASCATRYELPQESSPNVTSTASPPPLPAAPRISAKPSREVRASYQGTAQAGHLTASGESYDPKDLTAASRTLPIGSSVIVTNPTTGQAVKVRINDRLPHSSSRNLDLSKRAAEKIGLTKQGVARVKVKHANSKPETREAFSSPEDSSLTLSPDSER